MGKCLAQGLGWGGVRKQGLDLRLHCKHSRLFALFFSTSDFLLITVIIKSKFKWLSLENQSSNDCFLDKPMASSNKWIQSKELLHGTWRKWRKKRQDSISDHHELDWGGSRERQHVEFRFKDLPLGGGGGVGIKVPEDQLWSSSTRKKNRILSQLCSARSHSQGEKGLLFRS